MKGKTRSHLNFESHPLFMVVASLKVLGGLQKCSGMLNVLPYMVSVKRETQHLVARKWYGYRVEKEARFSKLRAFMVLSTWGVFGNLEFRSLETWRYAMARARSAGEALDTGRARTRGAPWVCAMGT